MLKALTLTAAAVATLGVAVEPAEAQDREQRSYFAEAGDFIVRARGIVVAPLEEDVKEITVIGGDIGIDNSVQPELDFTYFITDNIAVELIAAVSRHDVKAKNTALGDLPIGDLLLLPPTLTFQYHLPVTERFKPYVGAGVNATFFIDQDENTDAIEKFGARDTVGWALQAGFDYQIKGPWMFNADVKRLFVDTDATINDGAIKAIDVDIDPWIFGVGFGYRF